MTAADLDELFRDVVRQPDADSPRLAYAAACEACGDRDHADFIRIQLAYRDHLRAGGGEWFEDTRRELDLDNAHGRAWAGDIATRVSSYGFFGGFVERIKLDAKQFLATADELYRLAPIRRLSLTSVAPVLEELFRSPHLGRLVRLSLEYEELGDRAAEVIARSPQLRKLAWLDLSVNNITRSGLEALAKSDKLPSLRKVDLTGNPVFKEVEESVGDDQGHIVDVGEGLFEIEKRYGRKTWLHSTLDNGRRYLSEAAL